MTCLKCISYPSREFVSAGLWLAIFLFITSVLYLLIGVPGNIAFLVTNFLVMAFSFVGAGFRPFCHFSLTKIVFIFFYFFFGVVPLVNSIEGNIYWGVKPPTNSAQVLTNLIIIVGLFSFVFGGFFSKKLKLSRRKQKYSLSDLSVFVFFAFSILFFFIYFYIIDFSLADLMLRGLMGDEVSDTTGSLATVLLTNNVLRYIPFIAFLLVLAESRFVLRSSGMKKIMIVFFFVVAVISASPSGVSRYVVATLYIPVVILCTRLWDGPYRMQSSLIFGLLFVMPFLNKFRRFDSDSFSWSLDLSSFKEGHFDAYQNFSMVVERDWITGGEQLLGVLFFFVPRSIWPSKPIGSGAQLAQNLDLSFSNISMPYIAEFYLNFSVFGVFWGMLILGFLLASLDRTFWSLNEHDRNRPFSVYYYLLFGLIFFMMRGDLMSSFAYLVGLTVAFLITLFIFNLVFKFGFRKNC